MITSKITLNQAENNSNNKTIITIDNLYFRIWRNNYIRNCIRNNQLRDRIIVINNIEYLNDNKKYLSLLSHNDMIEYNIYTKFEINSQDKLVQYNINKKNHLINYISIDLTDKDINDEKEFGCDFINDGVTRLEVVLGNDGKEWGGRLPRSLREFSILGSRNNFSNIQGVADELLLNLPSQLVKLHISAEYSITTNEQIVLPESLTKLHYYPTNNNNLSKILVPPNKENLLEKEITIRSIEELQLIKNIQQISF